MAVGQQIAEPEVAVHDRGRQRRRCAGAQCGGDVVPPGSQRGVDRFQRVAPPFDFVERPNSRLRGQPNGARVQAVQLSQRHCRIPEAFADNIFGAAVRIVEERLVADSIEEGHHEQWRHVGRITRVFTENLGNWHRRRTQYLDDARLAQHVAVGDRWNSRRSDFDDHALIPALSHEGEA